MYRKYYSYSDMPQPIVPVPPPQHKEVVPVEKKEPKKDGILSNFERDDLILIVVLVILLMDECSDKLLLGALGVLFFSDKLKK